MIYFFQSVDGGTVKIGHSDNVGVRWKQLEAHYRCKLALLATMPGGRHEEAEIHEKFRDIRFGRTEQFKPSAELMAFIGRPLLVGANPDAVEVMVPLKQLTGTFIRVSDEFAEMIRDAASLEKMSVAEYADRYLLEAARARYRIALTAKIKEWDATD